MTRSVRAARQAVADRLAGVTEPCSLWEMSCVADAAARKVGRRTELYPSLYEYSDLLPGGWRTQWLTAKGGSGDSMLMVVPENWMPGQARSRSLLLGSGVLEPVSHSID